jgi:hypothetical protein
MSGTLFLPVLNSRLLLKEFGVVTDGCIENAALFSKRLLKNIF